MGQIKKPNPVIVFVGLLAGRKDWLNEGIKRLETSFASPKLMSPIWTFEKTDYYTEEMGPGLLRQFVAWGKLVEPSELARMKIKTNALEDELADAIRGPVKRPVNLDPGYITPSKLILATTKDYSHRIYLGEGIYAEVTLQWSKGQWRSWPWTYPDYAEPTYHEFFTRVRQALLEK